VRAGADLDSLRRELAAQVKQSRGDQWEDSGAEEVQQAGVSPLAETSTALEWARFLTELREYKAEAGNCDVPVGCPGYRELGEWVHRQRLAMKDGLLPPRRAMQLRQLGFGDAGSRVAAWRRAGSRLETFRRAHGHCNVPLDFPEDPQLGLWVFRQRQLRRAHALEEERVCFLDKLGFSWDEPR